MQDSKELICQSDMLVKNMETLSVEWTTIFSANIEHTCLRKFQKSLGILGTIGRSPVSLKMLTKHI